MIKFSCSSLTNPCLRNPASEHLDFERLAHLATFWLYTSVCEFRVHSHLTHTCHPCHGQIAVAVQLQRSLAEEEVDLIIIPIFTVAALPDQR